MKPPKEGRRDEAFSAVTVERAQFFSVAYQGGYPQLDEVENAEG